MKSHFAKAVVALVVLGGVGTALLQGHHQPVQPARAHVVAIAYPDWQLDG
ncbi:MAG: hypothetical protein ACREFP_16190 [Acetobacteraceae bacterium]